MHDPADPAHASHPSDFPHDRVAAGRVARVRNYRVRSQDQSILNEVDLAQRSVKKLTRAESEAARAWEACTAEQPWGPRCVFEGIGRGVLRIKAADSSVKYLADRWVRGGGLAAVRAEGKIAVRAIKVGI